MQLRKTYGKDDGDDNIVLVGNVDCSADVLTGTQDPGGDFKIDPLGIAVPAKAHWAHRHIAVPFLGAGRLSRPSLGGPACEPARASSLRSALPSPPLSRGRPRPHRTCVSSAPLRCCAARSSGVQRGLRILSATHVRTSASMDLTGAFDPTSMQYLTTQMVHPGAQDPYQDMLIPNDYQDHHSAYGYAG